MNPVMESQYSKSTKTNEEVLASSRRLTLDVIRPFIKLLKKLNLEETDIIAEEIGYGDRILHNPFGHCTLPDIRAMQTEGTQTTRTCFLLRKRGKQPLLIKATLLLLRSQFPKDALL